ncbi:MAG: FAD binding domain-containing protein [Clostridia bacterium]
MVNGFRPETLQEALAIRACEHVTPYAGGTDLMVRAPQDAIYLFIGHLPELRRITCAAGMLSFGAACTFSEVLDAPETPTLLKEAISHIAAPAIRNMGTIGGNVANASPKADSALIFHVLDAQVRLQSATGERLVPIASFYEGRNQTCLQADELLTEICLPVPRYDRYFYQKVGAREALSIARVSFAGVLQMQGDVIAHVATAYGAVADTILRRPDLDAMLVGLTLEQAAARKAQYLAAFDEAIVPIRGRVSAQYRKDVLMRLLERFLEQSGVR